MPRGKHDIQFLRGSVEDIQLFRNRPDLTEADFCGRVEEALKVANRAVVWAAKRSLSYSTEWTLGSHQKARRRWEDARRRW